MPYRSRNQMTLPHVALQWAGLADARFASMLPQVKKVGRLGAWAFDAEGYVQAGLDAGAARSSSSRSVPQQLLDTIEVLFKRDSI